MMDLANGDTIYVAATVNRTVQLDVDFDDELVGSVLTTEEARILANTLLAAVVEAESYKPPRSEGAMSAPD